MTIGGRPSGRGLSTTKSLARRLTRQGRGAKREDLMQLMKWLGGAALGATLLLGASSAFAVTIGFSQVGDEGDWRPAFSKDMQEEAKKEGIDLKFADAQGKEEEQLKAVRAFIAAEGRRDHHRAGRRHRLGPGAGRGQEGQYSGLPRRPRRRRRRQVAVRHPHLRRLQSRRQARRRLARPGEQGRTATSSSCRGPSARRRRSSARRASRPSSRTSRT